MSFSNIFFSVQCSVDIRIVVREKIVVVWSGIWSSI